MRYLLVSWRPIIYPSFTPHKNWTYPKWRQENIFGPMVPGSAPKWCTSFMRPDILIRRTPYAYFLLSFSSWWDLMAWFYRSTKTNEFVEHVPRIERVVQSIDEIFSFTQRWFMNFIALHVVLLLRMAYFCNYCGMFNLSFDSGDESEFSCQPREFLPTTEWAPCQAVISRVP